MARARVKRARTAAAFTGWRKALVLLALVAFTLQTYVVQTHVHFAHDGAQLAASSVKGSHTKTPASDDPANCPICQEFLHAGQFITPAAQSLLPPTLAVSTIALVDTALPFIRAPSHGWRGRAPPTL